MLIAAFAGPAAAQGGSAHAAFSAPALLKPGQFTWYEQPERVKVSLTDGQRVSVVVSLLDQQAFVYRGKRLIAITTVSTGSGGHETPTGTFPILQKKTFHRSNLYSNAPMPFMQRLTWTGIAMHAGHLPGYPASHGCIRLPAAFARQLYDLTELGGTVTVVSAYNEPSTYAPLAPDPVTPAPLLMAETRDLGGGAFDVVTMPADAARQARAPVFWVTGPRREIVQPIPRRAR